jgi:myo-inositol-1(or 4)-monophosphatase
VSDELLEVALAAARAAADELVRHAREGVALLATKSSATDPVTVADHAAEEAIRRVLGERRPDDAILGEEGGDLGGGTSGLRWVVDPLDGTVNFLYGHPQWCVSVCCEGRAGVVLDPLRGETFSVVAGDVATLQEGDLPPRRLRAREVASLGEALVATGFGYDAEVRREQAAIAAHLLPRVRDVRRAGSAALDLAWTAAGRHDAYFERGVKPWDIAAGAMLCEAAGLAVHRLEPSRRQDGGILVAAPAIAEELLALVA